jgi:hypothetical protein
MSTYCLSVAILNVISKTYILREVVGTKSALLTQCYNQLTIPITLMEIENRLIRGVDYQIVRRIYNFR